MSKLGADRLLTDVAALDAELKAPGPWVLFKHSTACPISAHAFAEYHAFVANEGKDVRTAVIRVIEERPVSNHAAKALGVAHQSPQAFVIAGGKATWNASHSAITQAALAKAVAVAPK